VAELLTDLRRVWNREVLVVRVCSHLKSPAQVLGSLCGEVATLDEVLVEERDGAGMAEELRLRMARRAMAA
jgi:hypothetical protein